MYSIPRLSREGYIFLGITALTAFLSFFTTISLIFLLFAMLLGVFFVSFLVSSLMVRGITVKRIFPARVHAGNEFMVQLAISNAKRWFPSYALVIRDVISTEGGHYRGKSFLIGVGPKGTEIASYTMTIFKRGKHKFVETIVSSRFPFGFFERSIRVDFTEPIIVYPRMGVIDEDELDPIQARHSGMRTLTRKGDEEFRALREYRPGENPHLIHWRISAHRGDLVVKELESEQTKKFAIFLDTNLEAVPKRYRRMFLEKGVSFAATLIHKLTMKGFGVRFHAFIPEFSDLCTTGQKIQLRHIFDTLAQLEGGAKTLDDLLPHIRENLRDTTIVLIKLSVEGSARLEQVFPKCKSYLVGGKDMNRIFRKTRWTRLGINHASRSDF